MQEMSYYSYEAYDQENVKKVRIPQQEWKDGVPELGAGGLPVVEGKVLWFKFREGYGMIDTEEGEVFFNFTAIPGEGYRTKSPVPGLNLSNSRQTGGWWPEISRLSKNHLNFFYERCLSCITSFSDRNLHLPRGRSFLVSPANITRSSLLIRYPRCSNIRLTTLFFPM